MSFLKILTIIPIALQSQMLFANDIHQQIKIDNANSYNLLKIPDKKTPSGFSIKTESQKITTQTQDIDKVINDAILKDRKEQNEIIKNCLSRKDIVLKSHCTWKWGGGRTEWGDMQTFNTIGKYIWDGESCVTVPIPSLTQVTTKSISHHKMQKTYGCQIIKR